MTRRFANPNQTSSSFESRRRRRRSSESLFAGGEMEVRDLLKDKKFWVASFLIAWAAALQGHMMWMRRQDSFKQKFGNLKEDTDNQDHDADSKCLGYGGVDVKHFLSGNFSDRVCRTSS